MSFDTYLDDAGRERLALLAEEMGETIQVIGKILRHGYASRHPNGGPTNRELLTKELGDVGYAIRLLSVFDDVREVEIERAMFEKSKSVRQYLHFQEGLVEYADE